MNITLTDEHGNLSMMSIDDASSAPQIAWDYLRRHNVESVIVRKTDGSFVASVACVIDEGVTS